MNTFFNTVMLADITLPFYEVALMLGVLTFCFLFRSYRFGLMAAFLFVFRLGWIFFERNFGLEQVGYIAAYSAFGLIVFVFACYELFFSDS